VNNSIVLDPDYQREVVWDEGRASLLITSILSESIPSFLFGGSLLTRAVGYFIPPIIFNVKETTIKVDGRDQQKYTRICVDGKQRLTSIWKFMTGQIGFFDSNVPQRKWYVTNYLKLLHGSDRELPGISVNQELMDGRNRQAISFSPRQSRSSLKANFSAATSTKS
jgi:hypothetical protein